jgi:regulator of protease activity HflC (stomatin/prohibitin superfamily)
MLDKLISFLLEIIDKLIPFIIIKQYEKSLLFRFGLFKKELLPGFHWKIPFVDEIDTYPVVTTTLTLPVQSIMTKDGIGVVTKGTIKYKISDLTVFGVEVADAIDALSDMTSGVIFNIITQRTLNESRECDLNKIITKEAKKEAKKWGIDIEMVTLTDFSKMNSLRLFNENNTLN